MKSISPLATGFSLFAMFFGAGNVVFPLFVGLFAGDKLPLALLGLLLTAVALPFTALLAMVNFRGQHRRYFQRVGNMGGRVLLFLCLFLLGPFLVVPRTVNIAHAAVNETLFPINPYLFGALYCLAILLLAFNTKTMLKLISRVFTPMLLILLFGVIIMGLILPPEPAVTQAPANPFLFGLREGYFTLDAIAALVFGQFVYVQLRREQKHLDHVHFKQHVIKAVLIAGGLLALVYMGLSYIALHHATPAMLAEDQKQALLVLLTMNVLPGPFAGVSGLIIAVACITTATALSKIFADYLHHFTRKRHWPISDTHCLIFTAAVTFVMSLLGFSQLMSWFAPIIVAFYPVFILLTLHAFAVQWIRPKFVPMAALICLVLGVASLGF